MNQHIALAHLLHHRAPRHQLARPSRLPRGEQQGRIVHQINQLHLAHQIDRAFDAKQRLLRQSMLLQQHIGQDRRARGRYLQAHGLPVVAVVQALAQGRAQIAHILLIDRQIRVARHAKLGKLRHLPARKQFGQMRPHDAGDADEQPLFARNFLRHGNQARQGTRHLHNGHFIGPAKGIHTIEAHDEIQRLVRHLRERVGRIQPHRHQQGLHLAQKVFMHPAALGGIALTVRNQTDAVGVKGRNQRLVIDVVLVRHQRLRLVHQRRKAGAGVTVALFASLGHRNMRGAAHLKPLIQVGRDDAQVAQTFQQGHILALSPAQYPFVEGQNAQIAVQQRQCWPHAHLRRRHRVRQFSGQGDGFLRLGVRIRPRQHNGIGIHSQQHRRRGCCAIGAGSSGGDNLRVSVQRKHLRHTRSAAVVTSLPVCRRCVTNA